MEIKCTQCGGDVPLEEDSLFVACPYCQTSLYVETDKTARHYVMPPLCQVQDVAPLIQRKLSYLEIRDPVEVSEVKFRYFPFWRLMLEGGAAVSIAAANPPVEEMIQIKTPSGEARLFSSEVSARHEVVEPEVLLEDAVEDARQLLENPELSFPRGDLLHLPLFETVYSCRKENHRAVVEAVSGEVYADRWPAGPQKSKDLVLGWIAVLTFVLFFLEAVFLPGFWLTMLAYGVTAVGVFFFAGDLLRRRGW